jgi:hypothetical protein
MAPVALSDERTNAEPCSRRSGLVVLPKRAKRKGGWRH